MKISVLFKEEVRSLNEDYTAGCERVFLSDITYLNSRKYLKKVYTSSLNNKIKSINKDKISHILYPHDFIIYFQKFVNVLHLNQRISDRLLKLNVLLLQLYYSLIFLFREHKADLFLTYHVPLVGLFFPKKTVVAYHNYCPNLELVFKILYLLQKDASSISFVFVSDSQRDMFIKSYPVITNSKIKVLHNAVDRRIFKPFPKNKNTITFVFLSAWVKDKGTHLLPDIISKVNAIYYKKVKFLIGGSLDLWSLSNEEYSKFTQIGKRIYKLANKYNNVEIIGKVLYNNIPAVLGTTTYTLLPSLLEEPFSLLLVESLTCGTPVIAFNVGGNKEIIKDGENGYIVNNKSLDSLTNRIINIIKNFDWDNYKTMSLKARNSSQKYSSAFRNTNFTKILFDCIS